MSEYNPYIDKTPFTNTVAANPYLLEHGISDVELKRVNVELNLWKMYQGVQWRNRRLDGEPQITVNYCKAFVDKGVAFLMGKGFNINVKTNALSITKPVLDEVWEDNHKELIGLDMAQSGGVTGNAWVKVAVETFDEEENPDMAELYPKGRIRIIVLPTYSTFPVWHAHDRDKMIACNIIYPIEVEQRKPNGNAERVKIWYREEITPKVIREYFNGDKVDERENKLGEIPVVRIKNLPLSGSSLGISDLQDIVPLQVEFNNKATDISDIINYHAGPITIVQGAKVSNLEKGARKVWGGLPKDAKVFNLTLETDLKAATNYLELIKTAMFELAHMPEDAFGKKMNISNTSGVALHIKNQPLMEVTRTKWVTYGEGIRNVNRLILKYAKLLEYPGFNIDEFEKLSPLEKYWSQVEFPNPLPKDDLIQMQLIAQKISLLLMSRKDALIELGETEAVKKIEEILKEAKLIQELVYADTVSEGGANEALKTNIGGILDADEKVINDDTQ